MNRYYLDEKAVKDYLNTLCNNKIVNIDINNLSNLITTREALTSAEQQVLKQVCKDNGQAWTNFLRKK